jgi:adenosylcobinamide-phosphate synthase
MRRRPDRWSRAAGLLLGVLADAALGDPVRGHPVAGFGHFADALEGRCYADSYRAGMVHTALSVGSVLAAGGLLGRIVRGRPLVETAIVAAATWAVLGGCSLSREGSALADAVQAGDLAAARATITHLCARDPNVLNAADLARAGCESIAENTSDAVVGPLFWGAVAGLPGLLGYRAVNTLDAMVGYRSPRYLRFGWSAARLDDLVNLIPARLTSALTVLLAPLVGGSPAASARAWRHDAGAHPSPNAGPVEATAAGALGIQLGGTTRYEFGDEQRPHLGAGRPPTVADLRRMIRLSRLLGAAAAGLAVAIAAPSARPA